MLKGNADIPNSQSDTVENIPKEPIIEEVLNPEVKKEPTRNDSWDWKDPTAL